MNNNILDAHRRGQKATRALRHLNNGKKIRISFSTGEIVEPFTGDAGIAAAVNILLGEDSDLITQIELVDEPAEKPTPHSYIIAFYPTGLNETLYSEIKANSDDEADAIAESIVYGGGEYDLYRSIY